MAMLFEKDSDLCLVNFSTSDRQDKFGQLVLIDLQSEVIQFEKDDCRRDTNSLIPINEWMILNKMEEIGSSHFKEAAMQKLSIERCLRHSHGRLQQSHISDTKAPPIRFNQALMNSQDMFNIQKPWPKHARVPYSASF